MMVNENFESNFHDVDVPMMERIINAKEKLDRSVEKFYKRDDIKELSKGKMGKVLPEKFHLTQPIQVHKTNEEKLLFNVINLIKEPDSDNYFIELVTDNYEGKINKVNDRFGLIPLEEVMEEKITVQEIESQFSDMITTSSSVYDLLEAKEKELGVKIVETKYAHNSDDLNVIAFRETDDSYIVWDSHKIINKDNEAIYEEFYNGQYDMEYKQAVEVLNVRSGETDLSSIKTSLINYVIDKKDSPLNSKEIDEINKNVNSLDFTQPIYIDYSDNKSDPDLFLDVVNFELYSEVEKYGSIDKETIKTFDSHEDIAREIKDNFKFIGVIYKPIEDMEM